MLQQRIVLSGIIVMLSIISAAVLPFFDLKINNSFVTYAILILSATWFLTYVWLYQHKLMRNIILSLLGMFAFAFCLVPLYNVFCQVTGLNGKVDMAVAAAAITVKIDTTRKIVVEFDVNYNEDMPWEFKPQHKSITVYPGQIVRTAYYASNPTKTTMRAQAIPSISPAQASKYFKKIECFCFNSQKLGPRETTHFGLQFFIDPKLPKEIKRLTLAYTLFDITSNQELKNYNPHVTTPQT